MNEVFVCPGCGGPLTYTSGSTVKCPFCGNSVIVPKDLKTKPLTYTGLQTSPHTPAWKIIVPMVVLTCVLAGVIAVVAVIQLKSKPRTVTVSKPSTPLVVTPIPVNKSVTTSSLATVSMKFGSKGIGPGMFNDAREIAIDGSGKIYVGDYSGGRVQIFDQSGTFIKQWMVDTKAALLGLAADRQGKVYIIQGGAIYRYDGATGVTHDHLDADDNNSFNDVKVTADDQLITATNGVRDDIIRYNEAGKPNLTIHKAISSQTDSSELDSKVAVDGLGNIYVLGVFNNAVFKFNRSGKFLNKFGGRGDQPGQLSAPLSIAVDGQGRVYVGDIHGIQVFDTEGRFIDMIPVEGTPFGIVFNDKNEMFVIAREQVVKYTINNKQ